MNSFIISHIEKTCFRWVSNPGPLACEASVITTTLRKPALLAGPAWKLCQYPNKSLDADDLVTSMFNKPIWLADIRSLVCVEAISIMIQHSIVTWIPLHCIPYKNTMYCGYLPLPDHLDSKIMRIAVLQSKTLPCLFLGTVAYKGSSDCKTCFRWVSNPGPLACEASVITTTLRKPPCWFWS